VQSNIRWSLETICCVYVRLESPVEISANGLLIV